MKKRFIVFFLLLLILPLNISAYDYPTITDSYDDENLISSYDGLYVNTTDGHVRIESLTDQPYDESDLFVWLHLDNETGFDTSTTAYDYSPEQNNVTFYTSPPEWTTDGRINGGLFYDYISPKLPRAFFTNDTSLLMGTDDIAFEGWVKFTDTADTRLYLPLMGKGATATDEGYLFNYRGDIGKLQLLVHNGTLRSSAVSDVIWLNNDNYQYIVINCDRDDATYFYVNNTLVGSPTGLQNLFEGHDIGGQINASLGCWGTGSSYAMNGTLDEIRVYHRIINETERIHNFEGFRDTGLLYSSNLLTGLNVSNIAQFSYETDFRNLNYSHALYLDGNNTDPENLQSGSDSSLDNLLSFTWETWLYTDLTVQSAICGKGKKSLVIKTNGQVRVNIQGTTRNALGYSTTNYLKANTWNHIVVLFDNSSDRIPHIFVNNTEVSYATEQSAQGNLRDDKSFNWSYGTHSGGGQEARFYFDEPRVYNRTITTTELTYSYNSHDGMVTPLNETGLVLWYNLNEGTGTDINDETANNNDGEINSGDGDEWVTGYVYVRPHVPYFESIDFQFSQNNMTWYNATHIGEWVTGLNGSNSIDLNPLGWDGGFFFYRANFTQYNNTTPYLHEIILTYADVDVNLELSSIAFIIGIIALILALAYGKKK